MTDEEIAKLIANNTGNIKDIQCPRDVKNPGLYFGAMLALQKARELDEKVEV